MNNIACNHAAKMPCLGLFVVLCSSVFVFATGKSLAQEMTQKDFENLLSVKTHQRSGGENTEEVKRLLSKLDNVQRSEAMWPIYTFIRAEWAFENRNLQQAGRLYRALINQAYSNLEHDTWGGNGLVTFALYRWLAIQAQNKEIDAAAFKEVSGWADDLLQRRLVRAVFEFHPILPSLPLIEEELYYLLAAMALSAELPDKAGQYYLRYLARLRTDTYEAQKSPLYDVVIKQGIATPDRIALVRGRRLFQLGRRREAISYIRKAYASENEEVRLEAAYLLARASRQIGREEKTKIYNEVNEYTSSKNLAQEALYWNALQYGFDDPEFQLYLKKLVQQFPQHEYTDDALFWLGRREQIGGNLKEAITWYRKILALKNKNNHVGRAAYYSALGLIWRAMSPDSSQVNNFTDLKKAQTILKEFHADYPDSIIQPHVLFWLGRIPEQLGDEGEARKWFKRCVVEFPFSYYGIRAKMHLENKTKARSQILITDENTKNWILQNYRNDVDLTKLDIKKNKKSVYLNRVHTSLNNGLYVAALQGGDLLRTIDGSKRLEEFSTGELEDSGLLTRIAVMLALRQDVLAAVDVNRSMADRVWLARQIGERASDWPLLLTVVHPVSVSINNQKRLMNTPGFLKTAYLGIYKDDVAQSIQKHRAKAAPAYVEGYQNDTLPALLYAVMRNESFFYPAAMSKAKALGLFQFIPKTFDELDAEWNLLEKSGVESRQAFLLNKDHAINLGVRWFAEKKLLAFNQNSFLATLSHHSGVDRRNVDRVGKWKQIWKNYGWLDDVEIMIETFRKPEFDEGEVDKFGVEARNFARWVITDVGIVDVLGLYQ